MKTKVLIVDDVAINRDILSEIFANSYEILQAQSGKEALEILGQHTKEDLVMLLDLVMPEMNGFEVLKAMRLSGMIERVPVLFITGETSIRSESEAFEYGAIDFIRKPFDPLIVKKRVQNIVELYQHKRHLEEQVNAQMEVLKAQFSMLKRQAEQLKESNNRIIDILGNVVEHRNLESGEHIKRVKEFTRILAGNMMELYPEYNLTPHRVDIIVQASALHDIGKIAIPDSILLKPGKLTPSEFETMKGHTTLGCEFLTHIEGVWNDEYKAVSHIICRHHHERYDGSGYPDGLKGDAFPIEAQLVSLADVYDALVSERCYKKAYSKKAAYDMIMGGECGVFSQKILKCFEVSRKELESFKDETDQKVQKSRRKRA
ncbi:MAG: response regulator [Lachnospiraceae bacterium]|nr:response regulator [Lachnospiraceae bacterium]